MTDEKTVREELQYRVALVHPDLGEMLVERDSNGLRLLRIRIGASARAVRELRRAIRQAIGVDVLILDLVFPDNGSDPVAFAEILLGSTESRLAHASVEQLPDSEISKVERHHLVKILQGEDENPFANVGWLRTAMTWLEAATGMPISSQDGFEQYNAGFGFTLMRFRMVDGSAYWLKAVGEPNRHELGITARLSRLCGKYLPNFVASHCAWHAWITREEAASIEDLPADANGFENLLFCAVTSMAALQGATIGQTGDLLKAGAFNQKLMRLISRSDEVFAYVADAMGRQTSTSVARVSAGRLREIDVSLKEACLRLDRLGLPETILHGDMNPGNILVSGSHCQFIDWAEAYIGNPLITLQHLLLLNRLTTSDARADLDRRLKAEYLTVFSQFCDASKVEEGFCYMPLVAAFSTLYARGDWLATDLRSDPRRQAYARMLARYMDRAADDLQHCAGFSGALIHVPVELKTAAAAEVDVCEAAL